MEEAKKIFRPCLRLRGGHFFHLPRPLVSRAKQIARITMWIIFQMSETAGLSKYNSTKARMRRKIFSSSSGRRFFSGSWVMGKLWVIKGKVRWWWSGNFRSFCSNAVFLKKWKYLQKTVCNCAMFKKWNLYSAESVGNSMFSPMCEQLPKKPVE